MNLGYICTNYNNSHYTVQAVESLLDSANDQHNVRVVVVDNCSTNENRDHLREMSHRYRQVEIVFNHENVGYFEGLNTGIRHFRSSHPDFNHFVIGNNDLLFPKHFCDSVVRSRDLLNTHPVVSPSITTTEGEHQNPHVVHKISKVREFVYDVFYSSYYVAKLIFFLAKLSKRITDRKDEQAFEDAQLIQQGHGSCYLIGPAFFEHVDELWAPTFLMGEEYFLSHQLSELGFQIYYNPSIHVIHCYHGSLKSVPSRVLWEYSKKAHHVYRKLNPLTLR